MSDPRLTDSELRAQFPGRSEDFYRRSARPDPARPSPSRTSKGSRERDLHDELDEYCRAAGYLVIHARMDMPSTIAVGHPDFTICMPGAVTCFVECKAPGGKTTVEQLRKVAHAKKLGFVAEIVDDMPGALAAMSSARERKAGEQRVS